MGLINEAPFFQTFAAAAGFPPPASIISYLFFPTTKQKSPAAAAKVIGDHPSSFCTRNLHEIIKLKLNKNEK